VNPLTVRATLVSQSTWGVRKALSLITNLSHFVHHEYEQIDRTVMMPMGLPQIAWSVQLVRYVHLVQLEFECVSSLNLILVLRCQGTSGTLNYGVESHPKLSKSGLDHQNQF